ncbi:MAG TPA: PH domain-containing protein [Roseiflexaceae bacterium]|nr:PH domain-containing protein [Roseiflexaceae bacterium]
MRRWKPQPSLGVWLALLLLIAAGTGAAMVGQDLLRDLSGPPERWPIDLPLYGRGLLFLALAAIVAFLGYRTIAALTLAYELDRNGLYITWLGNRAVVPLEQIQTVDVGVAATTLSWRIIQGLGSYWGYGQANNGKALFLFATRPLDQCLVIHTGDSVYAISPRDHEAFVQDLEQRRNLGATMPLAATVQPGRMVGYAFWSDRTVRLLVLVAFALNLLVLAVLAARYPGLTDTIQMRFNAAGEVQELRPRHQVLFLPMAAFGLSLLNTGLGLLLYRNQQLGARLLQGASVIVQVLFAVAVLNIIVR